ncbi:hypothetical protein H9Y04_19645 [Streptomyces sp. TRM66268-LWL]|uniref:Uncharacterized protein n=1 Tax=Streptomyces polyasparticus TaxID=2767826 RepID=A0ABR7SH00_9ACTN|nr:hypothetical protein [Streptomyces polyasparticus]MBC9714770.1 hypothetical protein [Streptomyces polyasparticus]
MPPPKPTPYALTVDAGAHALRAAVRDLRAADGLLHTLAAELALPDDVFGCTHLVRDDTPRVVVSLTFPTEPLLLSARERLTGQGYEASPGVPDAVGRAVLYPGVTHLTGTLTVGDVLARSAIDRVTVLGSPSVPDPDARLVTWDHVRPQWQHDALVLTTMPAAGNTLVPFEVPSPTPCCADH